MAIIIPTIHPANALRGAKPITDTIAADLAKAWRIANYGPSLYENLVVVLPSTDGGMDYVMQTALAWLRHWKWLRCWVSIDVETSSLNYFNCKLYSIAISGVDGNNTSVSFTLIDYHTIQNQYEQALIAELRELLADPMVGKVFHNAPYDRAVLYRKGFQVNGPMFDTQSGHHLVQPDIPHDLGWVGHTYLDVPPWKLNHEGEKMAHARDPRELLHYNAKDALYTGLLMQPLLRDIYSRGGNEMLVQYQMAFADLATDMEIAGLPINQDKRRARGKEIMLKLYQTQDKMRKFLEWSDFNPMSDKHRIEALFGQKYAQAPWNLGIRPTRFTEKTAAPSTGYRSIIDHLEHPFVRLLVDYVESRHTYATQYREGPDEEMRKMKELGLDQELKEIKSKDFKAGAYQLAICEDGRLHPKWNPTGQKGSRFSSSPNVQNVRLEDRFYFEPVPGRVLVAADKDQLELRICACLAGEPELLAEMAKPDGDPHRLAAIGVYGKAFLDKGADERKKLRDMVKNVVYASIYLAGVETVWRTVREKKFLKPAMRAAMTLPVVRHIYHGYFGKFTNIPKFHEAKLRRVNECGFLQIPPLGRTRYFPIKPPPFTELGNWDIQTIGSDQVGVEMVSIRKHLKKKFHGSAFIVLHNHDQVVVECNGGDAEYISTLVDKEFGNSRIEGPAGPVRLTAKAKIGRNLKEVK